VIAPPPLIPLVVILLAEALRVWRPLSLPGLGGDRARLLLALLLLLLAVGLGLGALLTLRRAHTPVEPWKPTRAVVTRGPYGFTRNPIYLAMLGVQLSYAWGRPNGWGVLLLPLTLLALEWGVIRREERYLAQRFGDRYHAYRRQVRRWL
jgi:protein-S-isoprenylcysteine O-methyltransferase Ste14